MKKIILCFVTTLVLISCGRKSDENTSGTDADQATSNAADTESVVYNFSDSGSLSEEDAKEVIRILSRIYTLDSLQGINSDDAKINAESLTIDPSDRQIELKPIRIETTDLGNYDPQASKNWAVDEKVFLQAVDRKAINYNNRTIPDDFREDYDRLIQILNRNNIPMTTPSSDSDF